MQVFEVTLRVVVNTFETVSAKEIGESIEDMLDDFDSGTAEVTECKEVNH